MRHKNRDLMDKIKKVVDEYALENGGKPPSTRDIGNFVGLSHVGVLRYLREMDELGTIRYRDGKISTDIIEKMEAPQPLIPAFYDSIPAGPEEDLAGMVEEFVSIPASFKRGMNGQFFLLRVAGESMVDAGISHGDIIIARNQADADVGDIVVALVEGHGSTLKRLRMDGDGYYLWAENNQWPDHKRFFGRDFSIQGVGVKVVKDI